MQRLIARRRYRHIHLKALADGGYTGTILPNEEALCLSGNCPAFHLSDTESVGVSSDTPLCCPRASQQEAKASLFTTSIIYGWPAMPPKRSSHVTRRDCSSCEVTGLGAPRAHILLSANGGATWHGLAPAQLLQVGRSRCQRQERKGAAFSTFWAILTCSDEPCNLKEAAKLSQPTQEKTTAHI